MFVWFSFVEITQIGACCQIVRTCVHDVDHCFAQQTLTTDLHTDHLYWKGFILDRAWILNNDIPYRPQEISTNLRLKQTKPTDFILTFKTDNDRVGLHIRCLYWFLISSARTIGTKEKKQNHHFSNPTQINTILYDKCPIMYLFENFVAWRTSNLVSGMYIDMTCVNNQSYSTNRRKQCWPFFYLIINVNHVIEVIDEV